MAIMNGVKIGTMVSAANGDTYGDGERHQFRTWQALIQANVLQVGLNTPPGSPTNGQTYVVGTVPTGAWVGQSNAIAYWAVDNQDGPSITPNIATGAWEFYTPLAGWEVYDNGITNATWRYNGTAWIPAGSLKVVVVATSSTTINPALANSFRINLNNVAGVVLTISAGAYDGQDIDILYVQGATTPSAVTFAASVHGATTPTATINVVSAQRFTWDATLTIWYALAAGATSM